MEEKLLLNNIIDIQFYLKNPCRRQIGNSMCCFSIYQRVYSNYIPVIGILELEDNRIVTTWIFRANFDHSEVTVKAEGQEYDWLGDYNSF